MTDETRARFLAAIADRVGAAGVEEVHLFPAIRQGGTESGVAVVAVRTDGPAEPDPESPAPTPEVRLTIHTARYRLVLKGPERGKWDFAIQAEADAPLVTVETVVRGVQRRSGDVEDPERFSGAEFRDRLAGASPG